jgi:hypothetical protein
MLPVLEIHHVGLSGVAAEAVMFYVFPIMSQPSTAPHNNLANQHSIALRRQLSSSVSYWMEGRESRYIMLNRPYPSISTRFPPTVIAVLSRREADTAQSLVRHGVMCLYVLWGDNRRPIVTTGDLN